MIEQKLQVSHGSLPWSRTSRLMRRAIHPCAVICLAHALMLAYGAIRDAPTVDEPVHLANGWMIWKYGRFDYLPGNPPLANMTSTLPLALSTTEGRTHAPTWLVFGKRGFPKLSVHETLRAFIIGRLLLIPFSILAACTCYSWARELYGPVAGYLALSLWVLSPNVLGHGHLMTCDIPATSLGVVACYAFWKWAEKPTLQAAAVVGITCGLAQLSKYVMVALYLIFAVYFLCTRFIPMHTKLSAWRALSHVALMVLTLTCVVNLGFFFDGSGKPLQVYRQEIEAVLPEWFVDRFGWLPVPLPEYYVRGITQVQRFLLIDRPSYLAGEWKVGGWWYYYAFAAILKLPLGTWLLVAAGTLSWISFFGSPPAARAQLLCLLAAFGFLGFVSTFTSINHHFRYALPMLPFLILIASRSATLLQVSTKPCVALSRTLIAAWIWSVASSLFVWPHSLAYFNEIAGGPSRGDQYLIDSNIDWGQDLYYLREWVSANQTDASLRLVYFGSLDPRILDIDFEGPPFPAINGGPRKDTSRSTQHRYAISVNFLRGLRFSAPAGNGQWSPVESTRYTYFLRARPIARIGYSIRVYDITDREIQLLLQR